MRIRTGHGPSDWTDNVPGAASAMRGGGYAPRSALVVGDMVPVLHGQGWSAAAKAAQSVKAKARYEVKCGFWMPKSKEACARQPGHRDSHMTARAMKEARS